MESHTTESRGPRVHGSMAEPDYASLLLLSENEGQKYTHISLSRRGKKYNFPSNKMQQMWMIYCDLVDQIDSDTFFDLGERQEENMPILARVTIRYNDSLNNPVPDEFVQGLIRAFQEAMIECLQLTDRLQLTCCVLENNETIYSDDERTEIHVFKLQFPLCVVSVADQKKIIRPRVIEIARELSIFNTLAQQPINDWETILDPQVPEVPWPLYMSTEDQKIAPFKLTHIYDDLRNQISEISLDEVFNPHEHKHVVNGLVSSEIFQEDYDLTHWLPMFLSVNFCTMITLLKSDIRRDTSDRRKKDIFSSQQPEQHERTDMDAAEELMPMLSEDRMKTKCYWLDVGKALYTCDGGDDQGLKTWKMYTRSFNHFTEEECQDLYHTFAEGNHITVATLKWYARADKPKAYAEWHEREVTNALVLATSGTDNAIAKAMHAMYGLDYVYAGESNSDETWYHYDKHRWVRENRGNDLRKALSSGFKNKFEHLRADLAKKIAESNNESYKRTGEELIKMLQKIVNNLGMHRHKSTYMKEAQEEFYVRDFRAKLDSNPHTMGVSNGVLEISNGECIFRKGKPEDYIMMYSMCMYPTAMTENNTQYIELTRWLRQTYTNNDLFNFFVIYSASMLKGANDDKKGLFFLGLTNNSKSMIIKLFEVVLGTHCRRAPSTMLTGKKSSSGAATPESYTIRHARLVVYDEIGDDEVINEALFKLETGKDKKTGRGLFKETEEWDPQYKMVGIMNTFPRFSGYGPAVRTRAMFLFHTSTFEYEAPEDEATQFATRTFKRDDNFERKIPGMGPAMLWLMVKMFPTYAKYGLPKPAIMTQGMERYWERNDPYAMFIRARLQITNNHNDLTPIEKLHDTFRSWFYKSFPDLKKSVPNLNQFQDNMILKIGEPVNGAWLGMKIIQINQEIIISQ